ncbi:MAG: thioredoxin family protein [Bacteroidetes bacterium]|nr:thioredoxin family protein [Bacteroidota bacterium]
MKKYLCFAVLLLLGKLASAQTDTSLLYLRFPVVPSFKLTKLPDSTIFTKDNLKKKKPTIIIMFSPDCEHCQAETKSLTAHIDLFKKAQIVMASPLEYNYLKKFYNEYHIADYPNITMGRDPSYFLGTFFKVRSFPAIFVYDKKGNYVTNFSGSVPVEQIANALQ